MTTTAEAIHEFVQRAGRKVSADEIKRYINATYPGTWQSSTVQAHLYGCVINNPKAYIHHPSARRFLYKYPDGTFGMYSEAEHGPNEWAPLEGEDDEADVVELVESSISLERDIEDHLVHHLDEIENGLKFIARQVTTDIGRIDILAEDCNGQRVAIEVKVGDAKDSAVGQIARYIGWYAKTEGKVPRGILVAGSFPDGVRYAALAVPSLSLVTYRARFDFESTSVE